MDIYGNIKSKKRYELMRNIVDCKELYLMMLPGIIFYIIFCYGPLYGIQIAFKEFWVTKGIWGSPWVGLNNFREIFEMPDFWRVLKNTLIINVYNLVFYFPAPIIVALFINEIKQEKFKRIIQTCIYFPHFISWVVIAGIAFSILSHDGIVNSLIATLGFNRVNFLSSNSTFRGLLVGTSVWKEVGWGTIIYLAAISGISPDFYEAATVDGASRWQQIRHITLPCIAPTISVLLIMRFGGMMNGSFDQVFNLYNSVVYESGDIIQTYIYRMGIVEGKFSMSTAVNLFLNVINFILLVSVNKISKKISGTGLY